MADTLMKSFLVGIGYKVDETSKKKADQQNRAFEEGMTGTQAEQLEKRKKLETKAREDREKKEREEHKRARERRREAFKESGDGLVRLGATAATVATGIQLSALGILTAVNKAAQGWDRLNYVAARSGSSARGVTAAGYAASQLGSDAGAAESTVAELGRKMKNPGYRDALERLGIKTTDGSGRMRDTSDLMTDLGDHLRGIQSRGGKYGYTQAMANANVFGVDEGMAQTIMDPRFRGMEEARKAQMNAVGADPNAAAASSTAFEQSMRKFQSVVEDIGTNLETVLTQKLRPTLDALAEWMTANSGQIEKFATDLLTGITSAATAIAESKPLWDALKKVSDGFEVLAKYLGNDDLKKYLGGTVDEFEKLHRALSALVTWIQDKLNIFGLGGGSGITAGPAVDSGVQPQHEYGGAGKGVGGKESANLRDYRSGGKPIGNGAFTAKAPNVMDRLKTDFPEMSNEDAAAVLGNLGHESAGFTAYHEGGGGGGVGWPQWTGSRRREYEAWSAANNLDPKSDEANYGFLRHELKGRYAGAITAVRNAHGLVGKTVAFEGAYEAAGIKAYGSRYRYANMALQAHERAATAIPRTNPMRALGGPHAATASPFGTLDPNAFKTKAPLGDTPALHQSIANSTKGDTSLTHNPTYNISTTGGPDAAMRAARMNAGLGWKDMMRNMQGQEQ